MNNVIAIFEPHRKNIEQKLRQLLNSDLPQVLPFLNNIGLISRSNVLHASALNYEEVSSIWYWFGVWDPVLQTIETIAIHSWLKQFLFRNVFHKIRFIRSRYHNKYELMQSFSKTYSIITWFTRHLFIARFIFNMNFNEQRNPSFLSTFYYRFLGYLSSTWFDLLFHIDINAPTLPLFLDDLENDETKVKSITKCAHLSNIIYGPQSMTMRFIRQFRWMILPQSMSNTLRQYSYSKYTQFINHQLSKYGFILQYFHVQDSHSRNFEIDLDSTDAIGGVLSYMIVLEKKTNDLYVVFRGTELVLDVYHDMFFSDVFSTYAKVAVHGGYYSALFGSGPSSLLSIEENINKILMQNASIQQICFTGHSMGGAVACLCGIELLARGQLLKTQWYEDNKSIYHHKHSSSDETNEDKNKKNISRLFREYMKLSKSSSFYDEKELHKIDIEFVTFGAPGCISSLTENKKVKRLQPAHSVYASSYFHQHAVHVIHEYDPIPILSHGSFGMLRRHLLKWLTFSKYFQPIVITLGSVITESSLGLEGQLSKYLGFNYFNKEDIDTGSNVLFGRFLICIAIHQLIRNKIFKSMTQSIYNHINYSSFNELDKINRSLYSSIGYKYLNASLNAALYPMIFYLMHNGFLDYGIWKALSLRLIATRLCISAISAIWNNASLIVRDFYEASTYFPIPNKTGKHLLLIPQDDVLYGTHLKNIKSSTGYSYFKAISKAVQPYTWFTVHNQNYYCKSMDMITTLDNNNTESMKYSNNRRRMSTEDSHERSRRSSIQLQQQIIAEVSPYDIDATLAYNH